MKCLTIYVAGADWLKAGGTGTTLGAKTIVIKNEEGDLLLSGAGPLLFAHVGDPPQAGAEVRCLTEMPIVGRFVRAELIESAPSRAPLYFWMLRDIRLEPGREDDHG
jgi:hypothetical protein